MGFFFDPTLDAVNHYWAERSRSCTEIYVDARKHDSMERKGDGNNLELKSGSFALEPFDDVVQVKYEVATTVVSLNKAKCMDVVVVPRGGIEVCIGYDLRSH
jgi:hypothetical protein